MTCLVVGCDPGKTGALCFVYGDPDRIRVLDMPLDSESGEVCGRTLIDMFEREAPGLIFYEHLWGPNFFRIGDSYGALRVSAISSRFRVEKAPPRTWQAAMLPPGTKGPATKRESIKKALTYVPRTTLLRAGKVDHNRADAVCLAHYALSVYAPV